MAPARLSYARIDRAETDDGTTPGRHLLGQHFGATTLPVFGHPQRTGFGPERARRRASGLDRFDPAKPGPSAAADTVLGPGEYAVESPVAGSLWQLRAMVGQRVAAGDVLLVLESMKTEIPVVAPRAGIVAAIAVAPASGWRCGR